MTTTTKSPPHAPLPFLGLACAVGVSTMYYNQPLLLEMGTTYGAAPGRTGFVAVATQVGYALGLLAFAIVFSLIVEGSIAAAFVGASLAWLIVSVAAWFARRKMRSAGRARAKKTAARRFSRSRCG